ncbi:2'-5'-oligoadenylate synthase 3-like [Struthio camelus]|uniref:2'-5'-oligoadenylate synthase 3-like n=1 Tax=Struthio camelus TaxID=8801 RepID=UPI00051E1BCB|nr:PREDICTED: 2'-5'-oligoadenylate synthase 3-like [Struthio camelus australis]
MLSQLLSCLMELYNTPSEQLDKFIYEVLQPDRTFLEQLRCAVHTICEFLRDNCFAGAPPPRTRVLKVVKGGSAGKGTALKKSSDADLVVFLSCFEDYKDQEKNRAEIIREIQKRLVECQQQKHFEVEFEVSRWSNPRVLSFQLSSKTLHESISFDVLPAYDALHHLVSGYKVNPTVYIQLFQQCSRGGEFSTCFTELQRDFIISRPTKVKSLIRLVKHWYKTYICPHKWALRGGETLPPQYALELLTVYAWEQGSGETNFSVAKAFRTVLELLQHYQQLCVYWTVNYDFRDATLSCHLSSQLSKSRPVILDPADPTNIVGKGSRWDLVAKEAEKCCSQRCCMYSNGVPVQPWDVSPEQTR